MQSRKDNLLKIIVEEYIQTANPIGSGLVVSKYLPEVSSATVRNDMAELEDDGLIFQPHTSAGRIPTAKGYQSYIENYVADGQLPENDKKKLGQLAREIKSDEAGIKTLAKTLSEICDNAVLVGFAPRNVYYTGISNLFRQPEFEKHALVFSMSEVIDHLDEVMAEIFDSIDEKARIIMGGENPFGEMSSVVLGKYGAAGLRPGLIGILGPNRMDYGRNLGLIKYVQEIIENLK